MSKNIIINVKESMDEWIGLHRFILRDALTGKIKHEMEYYNVITNALKTAEATSFAANITYSALGTGAGTPAATDTTLFTELTRKLVVDSSSSGSIISISSFFGASEGNGVLTEFGMFGFAATGTPDSGTMVNHVNIVETKSSAETLTIESSITIV